MLSATGLELSYGPQIVLNGVSLTIDETVCSGLVGANGSGKTTLLRILADEENPEAGSVVRAKQATIEYLPQRSTVPENLTVSELADQGYQREHTLVDERDRCASSLVDQPENQSLIERISEIDHDLDVSEYYTRSAKMGRVLSGLGFSIDDQTRLLSTFSGGWQMRAALARTLLGRPNILLLDEPTNYLDSEARIWLSSFLRSFKGGVLLVSHDRTFLDETVTSIYELFQGKIKRYTGTYTMYEEQRSTELAQLVSAWATQQKEIQKQEDFIRRFRATASKAKQVQSRVKALEKLERLELPEHFRPISISLPPPVPSGDTVLDLSSVTKSYDNNLVLSDVRFTLTRGRRLAVVGLNGAGKSTLLRLLSRKEAPDDGIVGTGTGVSIAYFAQDSADRLPSGPTILEYVSEQASDPSRPHVRDLLGSFLFSGDSVEKSLDVLSGGERSRVAMAALLVRPANLLIMDEPTNHLDIRSQEVLADALRNYSGTVVVVSHDRSFLRAVSTDVLALWPTERNGTLVPADHWRFYPGPYADFEGAELGKVFLNDAANDSSRTGTPSRQQESQNNEGSDKTLFREQKEKRGKRQRIERRETEILDELESLEHTFDSLQHELAQPENYQDGVAVQRLQKAIRKNESHRERLQTEWESLESERQEIE